jgi:hypothetical protein
MIDIIIFSFMLYLIIKTQNLNNWIWLFRFLPESIWVYLALITYFTEDHILQITEALNEKNFSTVH